ncbi:MAG TPA: hypothetical protein VK735_29005 [Pseudonocardia sp.]|jgi:hypothetical protein|uniref:hypothetical protein n=1 Tax=Pseudonocardia sp. TaxID=60912 RepID=UPI002B8CCB4A|nr:hypothetical protein [Pseudonocardia sp.]HTF51503.1 hypothetical protein [Pseudonocardia sp.]
MQALFYGIAAVACPVGMGLMMWMMMRGQRSGAGDSSNAGQANADQVTALRAEIDQLKAQQVAQHAQGQR